MVGEFDEVVVVETVSPRGDFSKGTWVATAVPGASAKEK